MLTTCSEPGCTTLVMGGRCLEHETPPTRIFVRGRPFATASAARTVTGGSIATLTTTPVRTLAFDDSFSLPRG
jgi:hypothetical protein